MDKNRLENFIKGKVENYKTPANSDLLWQNIQARQNLEKKPRRRFLFLWLFVGFITVSGLSAFFFYNKTTNRNDLSNAIAQTGEKQEDTSPQKSEYLKIDEIINVDKGEQESTQYAETTKSNPEQLKKQNDLNKTKNYHSEKRKNNFTQGIINTPDLESGPKSDLHSSEINQRKNLQLNSANNSVEPGVKNNQSLSMITHLQKSPSYTEVEQLPTRLIPPIIQKKQKSLTLNKITSYKKTPLPQNKKWNLSTAVYFNYGKAIRSLSGSDAESYIQIRDSLESGIDAIRAGLDFRLRNKSGFYIKTGLEYGQINERFDYQMAWDSTFIMPDQIIAIVYDVDGSSSNIIGEGAVHEFHYKSKKIYNRYYSIDIPILIGYESSMPKFNWLVEGGIAINAWFMPDGEILNKLGEPLILKDNTHLFKSNTGISLMSSAGFSYQINRKLNTWMSPSIKYQLNSITSSQYALQQKYLKAGMVIGLRWSWGN